MENVILSKNVPMVIGINLLKSHLRICHNHEDEYIKAIIKMATEIVENKTERSLITKEYQLVHYPTKDNILCKIKLPIRNIVNITKVAQGTQSIGYKLDRERNELSLLPTTDIPIIVHYTAGIADDVSHIPEELKFKVLCVAKNIYDCSDCEQIVKYHNYAGL